MVSAPGRVFLPASLCKMGIWGALGIYLAAMSGCERQAAETDAVSANGSTVVKWGRVDTFRLEIRDTPSKVPNSPWVQFVPLVVLNSGEVLSPVVKVERPRRNAMDGVYYVKQRQEPLVNCPQDMSVALPVDARIAEYLLVVRINDEQSGWRVLELPDLKQAARGILIIPDHSALPLIDERKDHDHLWEVYECAKKDFDKAEAEAEAAGR
jgi:hypothetical protein